MICHRCGKQLGGDDRVLMAGSKTVCGDCGRKKEPLVYTNAVRAMKAARKRALITGHAVSVTLLPNVDTKRVKYLVKVRRRDSTLVMTSQLEQT